MKTPDRIGNVRLMQRINRARVLDCIRQNDRSTRPALAAQTGLSLSSITNIVTYLMDRGLVCEKALEDAVHVGRKASLLGLYGEKYRVACVAAETDEIHAVCMNLSGLPLYSSVESISGGKAHVEARITSLLSALRSQFHDGLLAAAVSVPGMVLDGGRQVSSVSMEWKDHDLLTPFTERIGLPVFVQNSSIAKAIYIRSAIRRDRPRNAVFLDLENGIGAVHFTEQTVNPAFLGELGHTTVEARGARCFCGNRGCLELYCSPQKVASDCLAALAAGDAPGLAPFVRDGRLQYGDVVAAQEQGDAAAGEALARCGEYLGIALTSLILLLGPEVVYINGHELLRSRLVLETAQQYAQTHAYSQLVRNLQYRYVDADARATLAGLMEYTLDRLFDVDSPHCILD